MIQVYSITLRSLLPTDEDFSYEVYASTRLEELALIDWADEQKEAFLQMQFNAQRTHYRAHYPNAKYQIIQQGEIPIGRLIVERSQDPLLLIDIALLPEHRNTGIGTALTRDLMEEAAGRGWSVCLHVESFNPAMHLYERLGFVKTADQGLYQEMRWQPGPDRISPENKFGRNVQMLEFRQATFEGHLNTEFQVMEDAAVLCTLRLAEIRARAQTSKQETFSLLFIGPLDVFLGQGMRRLKHDRLGEFELFLVPIGKSDAGFQYEAVFNLLLESS